MEGLGLFPVNVVSATHFSSTTSTLLDVFFVSNKLDALLYDQLAVPCFSKHDLIFLAYNFVPDSDSPVIFFRNFNNIDYINLQSDLLRIEWQLIHNYTNIDDQIGFLDFNIHALYDKYIPLCRKNCSARIRPWFSQDIQDLIIKRDKAYCKWKRYRTPYTHNKFFQLRREVVKKIRKAKSNHYKAKFSGAAGSKETWSLVRELGFKQKGHTDIQENLDELNMKFVASGITNVSHNNLLQNSSSIFSALESRSFDFPSFSFSCVNDCDILENILKIKSNAVGPDEIDPKFLKLVLPHILPYITFIINQILFRSLFPRHWKVAKILPIPKSNNEFRPIAILPFLSKVVELIMFKQMSEYFIKNSLLTERQSGFRQGRSCISALIDVTEELRQNIENGEVSVLLLLDHTKAFNKVDPVIFLGKVKNLYNFSDSAIKLLRSYLLDRSQFVCSGQRVSNSLSLDRGVPQGSILGPFLFSIFINDFPNILNNAHCHMYADDIQVYASYKPSNLANGLAIMNENLERIGSWASQNSLELNASKSKCILIYKKAIDYQNFSKLSVNDVDIEYVKSVKNLGVVFNQTLSWNNHINYVCGKTYGSLRTLWNVQQCLPTTTRQMIAKSCLMPVLLYGCELFAQCDSEHKHKLNVLFNSIARFVFGRKRHESISAYAKSLYDVCFNDLIQIRSLIFLHKIVYTKTPPYLYQRLHFSRSTRTFAINQLEFHTNISERQFFVNTIRLWNRLPVDIKRTSNALEFKRLIFKYFA